MHEYDSTFVDCSIYEAECRVEVGQEVGRRDVVHIDYFIDEALGEEWTPIRGNCENMSYSLLLQPELIRGTSNVAQVEVVFYFVHLRFF